MIKVRQNAPRVLENGDVLLKVVDSWGNRSTERIRPGDHIRVFIDPFQEDINGNGSAYIDDMDYDELVSNIDEDASEFIDDLMYISEIEVVD